LKKKTFVFKHERNYDARTKPLTVVEPVDAAVNTKAVNLKTSTKISCKMINADNLDELINLLKKVI
jgi:electron transfer flavoprotein beta subunit